LLFFPYVFTLNAWNIYNKDSSTKNHFKSSKTRRCSYLDLEAMLRIRIWDPVLFDLWIRDPGWEKNPDPGSGMSIPDLGFKILKFFDPDPGSCQPWIRDPG
jgi:hypothetical protein